MSYKKKFLNKSGASSPISGINSNNGAWNNSSGTQNGHASTDFGYKNYMSRLPEVYTGHPNRIERYNQYEMMDVDAEINACLDIISEFSTQRNEHNKTPFSFEFKEDPTPHEVELLTKQLQQWCKLNEFDVRIFKIFRNIIKYGDQVFVRDPENFKLYWVDMVKVIKVIVNESEGKKPEQYVLKDINVNLQNLSVAQKTNTDFAANPATGLGGSGGGTNTPYTVPAMPYNTSGSRFTLGQSESAIDGKHILHLSLTEGLDRFWPFGQSILENIFKVYKQKELLEDAVLIYRVQRAPERRMFKIDVGNMPSHLAMAFVERVKNEIHQRRIPSVYGGQSIVDATYNPLCLDLETKIPLLDGRTLSLRDIIAEFEEGKENWAYSCDPVTGKVVPGVINWAGVTRKDAEVLELTFDNGKTLVCTPDHKIPVFGKGFIEAKDLTTADELITYSQIEQAIWDQPSGAHVDIADLVGGFFNELSKHQEFTFLQEAITQRKDMIVHKDGRVSNNNPNNLMFVNSDDYHLYLQVSQGDFWTTEYSLAYSIDEAIAKSWPTLTAERRRTLFWCAKYGLSTEELHNDPSAKDQYLDAARALKENITCATPFVPATISGAVNKTKLTSITPYSNIDTGTITIDGLHRWHDYHTFAIDAGIFVKNSMNEDYFFPVTCLTLDTPIPLLDGRTLTLQEMIDEHAAGKQNWVYSVNQTTFEMEPGKIVWAGVTRKNATLVEVELDNGEKVRVTPDHRFIMRDGTEVEAQYLNTGDSLMPLYLSESKTSPKQKGKPYLRYVDNATGKIKWVHTTVMPKAHSGKDTVIHHIDYDSRNNNPSNLVEMSNEDHIELHRNAGTYSLAKQWNCPKSREKLITGIRDYHNNRTEEDTALIKERNRKNAISGHANMSEDTRRVWSKKLSDSLYARDLKLEYSPKMVEYVQSYAIAYKDSIHSIDDLQLALESDTEFMALWHSVNENRLGKNKTIDVSITMFSAPRIRELFALTEYKSWQNFSKAIGIEVERYSFSELNKINYAVRVQEYEKSPTTCKQCGQEFAYVRRNGKFCNTSCSTRYNNLNGVLGAQVTKTKSAYHNHKVKTVTWLPTREDTGDITVEGNHNFAVAAGVYIHNSEGRGSSVEVLPGGQNLGEIDDLRYFNNRLARGLRVPSSYLPTGPDDNTTPLSDGRVGTAMIQEFRFNQYCERLQNYMALKLDEEFKLFLRWRGFNIDTSLFQLVFNPPQNFAAYRQSELDNARVGTFTSMESLPYISKRFALERFLGLTEEEIKRNEKLWEEENKEEVTNEPGGSDLRNIGVSTGDFEADMQTADEIEAGDEMADMGPEAAGPVGDAGGAAVPGGAAGPVGGGPMQI